jgi:hypothetical protein
MRTVPGSKHLIFEEGNLAAWMYEILAPVAQETVVVRVCKKNRGSKSDEIDAFALAESLRTKSFENRVYKKLGEFSELSELARAYRVVMRDSVRAQNHSPGGVSNARVFRAG